MIDFVKNEGLKIYWMWRYMNYQFTTSGCKLAHKGS